MATTEHIAELFQARLANDSSKQLAKAGDMWPELPLNFFYLTHAEDTVDIVVTSIAEQVAKEDGIKIPGSVLKNLQQAVTPETLVKRAIFLIFLTTFQPPPA